MPAESLYKFLLVKRRDGLLHKMSHLSICLSGNLHTTHTIRSSVSQVPSNPQWDNLYDAGSFSKLYTCSAIQKLSTWTPITFTKCHSNLAHLLTYHFLMIHFILSCHPCLCLLYWGVEQKYHGRYRRQSNTCASTSRYVLLTPSLTYVHTASTTNICVKRIMTQVYDNTQNYTARFKCTTLRKSKAEQTTRLISTASVEMVSFLQAFLQQALCFQYPQCMLNILTTKSALI